MVAESQDGLVTNPPQTAELPPLPTPLDLKREQLSRMFASLSHSKYYRPSDEFRAIWNTAFKPIPDDPEHFQMKYYTAKPTEGDKIVYDVATLTISEEEFKTPFFQLLVSKKYQRTFEAQRHGQMLSGGKNFTDQTHLSGGAEEQTRGLATASYAFTEALRDAQREYSELKLSAIDKMTGVWNRQALDHYIDAIQEAMRRHPDEYAGMTLMIFDVDNFKHFNEKYMYETGDKVLKNFAATADSITDLLTRNDLDFFARMGGEEFALLLIHTRKRTGHMKTGELAQTIKQRMEEKCQAIHEACTNFHIEGPQGEDLEVTTSAGFKFFSTEQASSTHPESLRKETEFFLKQAKKTAGKNTVLGSPMFEKNYQI